MSLHLIESTKRVSVANRKRGGATASVIVHCLLVIGAFSVASATPETFSKPESKTLLYVAPPQPPTLQVTPTTSVGGSSVAHSEQRLVMPTMPSLDNITIDVQAVSLDIPIDMSVRDFSRRNAGNGAGSESGGGGYGTASTGSGGILSDLQVDKQVVALSGYRTPRYPEAMRSMGIETTITAQFVVDTLGRIETSSLEFRDASYPQFFPAVRDALANARFRPAEVNGKRVRQLVMQSFVFSLARD